MSDQTITSLIEKLEGASEGSTKLDCYVGLCARTDGKGDIVIVRDKYVIKDAGGTYAAQPYTTSLDAALALAERLDLDGWKTLYAAMMSWKAHDPRGPLSTSLPLSLCAAVLRAQSEARV